jgi:hypothetical protein
MEILQTGKLAMYRASIRGRTEKVEYKPNPTPSAATEGEHLNFDRRCSDDWTRFF